MIIIRNWCSNWPSKIIIIRNWCSKWKWLQLETGVQNDKENDYLWLETGVQNDYQKWL